MKVALHACCGPCLLEPFDALASSHDVTVVYANPNIHPAEEYVRRRDTLADYAAEHGIPVVELAYAPETWERAIADDPEAPARCRACFRLRLGMVAAWAAEHGFDAVATTLTVSPYQDAGAILEAGEAVAAEAGVRYLPTDFRERYRAAVERSKDLGMYRQRYCGCVLSEQEAEEARSSRRR